MVRGDVDWIIHINVTWLAFCSCCKDVESQGEVNLPSGEVLAQNASEAESRDYLRLGC